MASYGTSASLGRYQITMYHSRRQSTYVITSHIITPNDHTSDFSVKVDVAKLSGAMYRIGGRPGRSIFQKSCPATIRRAIPKSPSFALFPTPIRTLRTEMSRCTMRFCVPSGYCRLEHRDSLTSARNLQASTTCVGNSSISFSRSLFDVVLHARRKVPRSLYSINSNTVSHGLRALQMPIIYRGAA